MKGRQQTVMGRAQRLAVTRSRPAAAVAETHAATVMFLGDRAYKIKKPVNFGFLDFTTVAARHQACQRELVLNRRLAPDVYLGLNEVRDEAGRSCEWIVVMRRMPADRRLSTLVQQGVDVRDDVRQIARLIAGFHAAATTGPHIASAGTPDALRKRWTDNLAGVAPYRGSLVDDAQFDGIAELALDYIDGRAALLRDRVDRGCIVDGHGDLLAEDIFCLTDGPRVLDCLEFDDALRFVDGLDDAAFLAMDLERLGAPKLAQDFLHWYREFSRTPVAASLAHHYVAFRAFVRAKVACLRHDQGDSDVLTTVRQLTAMTLAHLRTAQVRLILVGGLPGTGKSTISGGLADRLGAVLLRTDQIRREMPHARERDTQTGYGQGLYDPQQVHATYHKMLDRARALLHRGETVVLDATWNSVDERESARRVARDSAAAVTELCCVAPQEVTQRRIAVRVGDVSDATSAVARRIGADFTAWPEATVLDTSGPAEPAIATALQIVQ